MHKKGITEEVAKKRSRKTVKHQRGIVGADLAAIAARRTQSVQVRAAQRASAIQKAKAEKKAKEDKKDKSKVCLQCVLFNGCFTRLLFQTTRAPVASGPRVSKAQMKGSKGGR